MNKILYALLLTFCVPLLLLGQQSLKLREINFVFEYKDVTGTIGDFRSVSKIDIDDFSNATFEGSVSTASLKTGNFLRDWSLKGRKYFNEDDYPRIHFKSTGVSEIEDTIEVEGVLTMKGNSNPLSIIFKQENGQLIGSATLYTSDYGIQIKKKRAENKVRIAFVFDLEE